MKTKYFVILLTCISFLFFGCESGPKKIKFNELPSKTFTLFRLFYMTLIDESDKNAAEIFASLPINEIIHEIETRYGVNIDSSLFSDTQNNISKIKSYNLATRNYVIDQGTNEFQRISIGINRLNQKELTIEIHFTIYENDKISSRNDYTFTIPYF
jgi:hypothetical protein